MTNTARVRVDGQITIADLHAPEIERLRRELSFPNPEYVTAMRMNRQVTVPDRIDCVRELPNGNIMIPRGAILDCKSVLADRDTQIDIIRDERERHTFEPPTDPPKPLTLRDYQAEGVRRLVAHAQGVITFPCGTGKTSTGIGAIAALKQTTLVIVHTDDLLEQWVEDVRDNLGFEAGVVRGGGVDVEWKAITIASVHKLVRMLKDPATLAELRKFGFCIVDEAHHAPASTFTKVINHVPAFYRLGLTATPEREDGLTKLVYWTFGDTLSSRTIPQMVAAGWLELPLGFAVHTELVYEYKGGRPDKKTEATARAVYMNAKRNALVSKYAHGCFQMGHVTLVLTSRKAHHAKLIVACEARGLSIEGGTLIGIGGHSTRKQRKAAFDRMRTGERIVVVSMPIMDEGVNVPALGALLLAFPERAEGKIIQRVGRIMRPYKGVTPELYDFVDDGCEMLSNRWDERRRIFAKMGIEIERIAA